MAWHIVSITKGEILLMAIAKQLAKCTQSFHLYFFIPTCLLSEADWLYSTQFTKCYTNYYVFFRTKNIFKTRNIQ